ncbi:hypothetical protein T492DRAFT_1091530 [Pavlovales sp. CCMP2436]|nr:hypothetical protein T492DRAFT_1091530 [Pavlovales sp. CCMP2436]
MSSTGIDTCLAALGASGRSEICSAYVRATEGCAAELEGSGVCAAAAMDGEAMPCLIQRVKPAQLSEGCQAALPKKVVGDGLADTFWKDGKRLLTDAEMNQLKGDDVEIYAGFHKRKSGKKTDKDRDRAYAVKQQKKQQVTLSITAQAEAAAVAALAFGKDPAEAAEEAALNAAEEAINTDLTRTLKSFSKSEMKEIVSAAVVKAQKSAAKSEL